MKKDFFEGIFLFLSQITSFYKKVMSKDVIHVNMLSFAK